MDFSDVEEANQQGACSNTHKAELGQDRRLYDAWGREQKGIVVNLLLKWSFCLFFLSRKTSEANREWFRLYIYLTGEQNT